MIELVASDRQQKFGQDKFDSLPQQHLDCEVRFACHGECPKHRFTTTAAGDPGLNYLCAGWYNFFTYIDHPIKIMVSLMQADRPTAEVMPILVREAAALKPSSATAARERSRYPYPTDYPSTRLSHGREWWRVLNSVRSGFPDRNNYIQLFIKGA